MDNSLKLCFFSLLLVICQEPVAPQCFPGVSSFDLYFTEITTSDYVVHQGLAVSTAFTVCYRVRTTETSSNRVVFSYATSSSSSGNEIVLFSRSNNVISLGVNNKFKDVPFQSTNDGSWHHVCATWDNENGEYNLYRDGNLEGSGQGLETGHVISSDGTLVIGQDQDKVGGGFEKDQCYVGQLTDLNVWDRVLSADHISDMSRLCFISPGNVKNWVDFYTGIRGSVRVMSPSACSA